jgi:hypothetical protein
MRLLGRSLARPPAWSAGRVPGAATLGADVQPEQQWQREPTAPSHRQRHPERQHHPDVAEAAERLAGRRQQRVVVHRRQADPLARLARQRVVDQEVQGVVGRDPGQRQPEHHLPQRIQAPRRAAEEPMEHRDMAAVDATRRHRHGGDRPPTQAVDPAGHHQTERSVARRMEARLEGNEQANERAR